MDDSLFMVLALVLPLLLISGAFAWRGYMQRQRTSVNRWPETLGRIVFITVDERENADGSRLYYPSIMFEYEVNGKRYQSNRLNIREAVGYASAEEARATTSAYSIGKRVEIYYDPKNPRTAVLER